MVGEIDSSHIESLIQATVRFGAAVQTSLKWKLSGTGEQRLGKYLPGCSKKSLGPPFPSDLVLLQCRKSSWGFMTCRQLCLAGLKRGCMSPPWSRPCGTGEDVEAPLPATARRRCSLKGLCSSDMSVCSPMPCLEDRQDGVQCTWVWSRALPLRWAGMRACGNWFPCLPLSFLGEGAAF